VVCAVEPVTTKWGEQCITPASELRNCVELVSKTKAVYGSSDLELRANIVDAGLSSVTRG
jgi:hypothetical protein